MSWLHRPRCDETPSWALLAAHHARCFEGPAAFELHRAFAEDAQRVAAFSFDAPPVFADLSKNLIDREAQQLLNQLARECGVEAHRDAMLRGAPINTSEQRAVTHVHWRWALNQAATTANQAQAAINSIVHSRVSRASAARSVSSCLAKQKRMVFCSKPSP